MGIDVVLESTGRFTDKEGAGQHLTAGAKKSSDLGTRHGQYPHGSAGR